MGGRSGFDAERYLILGRLQCVGRLLPREDPVTNRKARPAPVSYTHLDVYKRQVHVQRLKDASIQDVAESLMGDFGDNKPQQNVTGIAISPTRSRRELRLLLSLEQS